MTGEAGLGAGRGFGCFPAVIGSARGGGSAASPLGRTDGRGSSVTGAESETETGWGHQGPECAAASGSARGPPCRRGGVGPGRGGGALGPASRGAGLEAAPEKLRGGGAGGGAGGLRAPLRV